MTEPANTNFEHEGGSDSALERLKLFSDAVIAIALTLLVIEIRLPEAHHLSEAQLWSTLISLWPRYLAFFVSFLVIGTLWMAHWRKFQLIGNTSPRLLWLNLLFLFSICCIPFATGVLGEHGNLKTAVIVYAVAIIFAALTSSGLSLYASKVGLMKDGVTPEQVKRSVLNPLYTAAVFSVSIGIALFDADLAKYFWLALIGSVFFGNRTAGR